MMGARGYSRAEEPVHEVEITQDFYLGIYPVTHAQFRAWTQAQGIEHKNKFEGKVQHPVENLNWFEARQYCHWLMQLDSTHLMPDGFQARLPTEAEWEYACSAWQETEAGRIYTEYHTGDGVGALQQAGWFGAFFEDDNQRNVLDSSTQAAGQLTCNRHGLHDMHGNVWEWCLDAFDLAEYSRSAGLCCDPFCSDENGSRIHPCTVPLELSDQGGTYRVRRGGSCFNHATFCRASYRGRYLPDNRNWIVGFRVGLFPVPCQQEQPDQ